MFNWAPLQVHSDYSLLKGLSKPEKLVNEAYKFGFTSLTLTDTLSVAGWTKFFKEAHKYGIKPIIGFESIISLDNIKGQAVILAKNNNGYKAILNIISSVLTRFKQDIVIDKLYLDIKEILPYLSDLIILLSGGIDGLASNIHNKGELSSLKNFLQIYNHNKNIYLTIERWGVGLSIHCESKLIDFSLDTNTPVVANSPVLFLEKKDSKVHKVRIAIQKGLFINDKNLTNEQIDNSYLPEKEEIFKRYADVKDFIENTSQLIFRCNVFPEKFSFKMPKAIINESGISDYSFLKKITEDGFKKRLNHFNKIKKIINEKIYWERIYNELIMIEKMGFCSYFLVVSEFIKWSKDNCIPVGVGRGSGVGSLVAYSLNITDLDPIDYKLLFERFLNPARIAMPDFDIDFCPKMRDIVIDHVVEIYGQDNVAQIAAYGNLRARASIRDVGRVLQFPYGFIDKLARCIPNEPNITLENALIVSPMLKQWYEEDENAKNIINFAKIIEGSVRHLGKHAGGVVISPEPLTNYTPLVLDADGHRLMTQFDKSDIEALGLVKFDFLGLTTLTIIKETIDYIQENNKKYGLPEFDLLSIPLDDAKSFELLRSCKTEAIFQLETRGAKALINKLLPDRFEEIIALVALNRPGPLQSGMVDNFINRKHGKEKIAYPDEKYQHELLKPILEETFGIILYQEQVIQIAQVLSGYTLEEADLFRRAMGKKDEKIMETQRCRFLEGAIKNGIDGTLASKIFELVDKFAGYGFNKSHSAAYAYISYQTLYLKAQYTDFFMAAVLSSEVNNLEKLAMLLGAIRGLGLKIVNPDINRCFGRFFVEDRGIINYGLEAIRGLGKKTIDHIISERQKNGNFVSLYDFIKRIDHSLVTKSAIEKLVLAGAFDEIEDNRSKLFNAIPELLKNIEKDNKQEIFQQDIWGIIEKPSYKEINNIDVLDSINSFWNIYDQSFKEYHVFGCFLKINPMQFLEKELNYLGYDASKKLLSELLVDLNGPKYKKNYSIAAMLERIRVSRNKSGEIFSILTMNYHNEIFEAFYPNKLTIEERDSLVPGEVICMSGKWREMIPAEPPRMNILKFNTLRNIRSDTANKISILLSNEIFNNKNKQLFNNSFLEWLNELQTLRSKIATLDLNIALDNVDGFSVWELSNLDNSKFSGFSFHSFPLLNTSKLFPYLQGISVGYNNENFSYMQKI